MTATALEKELLDIIAMEGPLAIDRYMALCLNHPRHGYYMSRDPFGLTGDFVTAPEVTQMFGELIGVWCAQAYELMGRPAAFDLIELGPGRGTLMTDILRTARQVPEMLGAVRVRLIETSPRLRALQREALKSWTSNLSWHDVLDELDGSPCIIVANEFFDALPIRQFRRANGGWRERVVQARDGKLVLGWKPSLLPPAEQVAGCAEGEIVEVSPAAGRIARSISARLNYHPGAALIMDFGRLRSLPGETLRAVRGHRGVSILERPGESDLAAHVDFEILGRALAANGARVCAPLTQGKFLRAMGIEARARVLKAALAGSALCDIDAAVERVAGARQMGELFKVVAATSPGMERPYPFVAEIP
jgi:SAM-dependent MidA family methyltransferase